MSHSTQTSGASITRTLVLHPYLKGERDNPRDPVSRLEEAIRLAHAIALDIVDEMIVPLAGIKPATMIGTGKVEEIGEHIKELEVALVVVDGSLSPAQQRNLEKAWECKVIDRTALILEIFGARARTHEGKLQVELASLNYQKSRLVKSWTHLERQRGGFGFLGGPGESQIEIDRRLIRDRITKIQTELEGVKRTRELHRKTRRDVPYPVVALVGYTNAGKSTLFNTLTGANVMVKDLLFATLDPTLRSVKLGSGSKVILSDTVGFVSDLPHDLVAAFRATLEEVIEADVILHVRDISHPDSSAQKDDVMKVLAGLLDEETIHSRIIEVLNKIDNLPDEEQQLWIGRNCANQIAVSARANIGIETLKDHIDEYITEHFLETTTVTIPMSDGKTFAWLHANGSIISKKAKKENWVIKARLTPENIERLKKLS